MRDGPNITAIAALIGDQARAEVLNLLMSGMALTATELADGAGVTRQTISGHLAKLAQAGLVAVQAQGRHRYFRIADPEVAQLLESMMGLAFGSGHVRLRSSPREPALRKARVCYDHLAGELGVLMYERLAHHHCFAVDAAGIALTPAGHARVRTLGVEPDAPVLRRPLCRTCMDWSMRRNHLAGGLGSALLDRFHQLGWVRRVPDSRVLDFSSEGEAALRAWLA